MRTDPNAGKTPTRLLTYLRKVNRAHPPEESVLLRIAVLVAALSAVSALARSALGDPFLGGVALLGIPLGFLYSYRVRSKDPFVRKILLSGLVLWVFGRFLDTLLQVDAENPANIQLPLAELFLWVQLLHSFDVPSRRDLLFSLLSSLILITVSGTFAITTDHGIFLLFWGYASLAALMLIEQSKLQEIPQLQQDKTPQPTTQVTRQGSDLLSERLRKLLRRPLQHSPHETAAHRFHFTTGKNLARMSIALVACGLLIFLFLPSARQSTSFPLSFPSQLTNRIAVGIPGGLSNPSLGNADPSGNNRGNRAASGYFGFSEQLDTGLRGRPDNSLVMRVRAPGPAFWRGQTFDNWDGRLWQTSDSTPRPIRGPAPLPLPTSPYQHLMDNAKFGALPRKDLPDKTFAQELSATQKTANQDFTQTFYLEAPGPNIIFGAYVPDRLYFPDQGIFQLPDGTLLAGVQLDTDTVYTVISKRPHVTPELLRRAEKHVQDLPSATQNQGLLRLYTQYTQLPPSTPQRVRDLAAHITQHALTTYDKVLMLQAWMARNTRYSLDIPPLPDGADAVDTFLFEEQVGFCEQIGTSLVVMLRALGIPARLVVGYTPGEHNPFTGMFEVKASDAHAWAEVYFPGIGWQGFDPTAEVPLSGEATSFRVLRDLATYLGKRRRGAIGGVSLLVFAWCSITIWQRTRATRRAQQAFLAASWHQQALSRLEEAGTRAGTPRFSAETVPAYLERLADFTSVAASGKTEKQSLSSEVQAPTASLLRHSTPGPHTKTAQKTAADKTVNPVKETAAILEESAFSPHGFQGISPARRATAERTITRLLSLLDKPKDSAAKGTSKKTTSAHKK